MRTVAVVLALVSAFTFTACKTLTPTQQKLVDCVKVEGAEQIPNLVPLVLAALTSAPIDWKAEMDKLVDSFGDVIICALKVASDDLQYQLSKPTVRVMAAPETAVPDTSATPVELKIYWAKRYLKNYKVNCEAPQPAPLQPVTPATK